MQNSKVLVRVQKFLVCASIISQTLLICGCGGGPNPVQVSGTVSYKGKKVPYGHISFIAGASPQGKQERITSSIKQGLYELPSGKSLGGGEQYRVEVGGFSGAPNGEDDAAAPLFQLWSQTVTVPEQGGILDFEVN